MKIVLVAAIGENNVIGQDGDLPWRLKSDLQHFRALTINRPVIMGRKTFKSIGKPLKDRTNIVRDARPRPCRAGRACSRPASRRRWRSRATMPKSAASTRSWSSAAATSSPPPCRCADAAGNHPRPCRAGRRRVFSAIDPADVARSVAQRAAPAGPQDDADFHRRDLCEALKPAKAPKPRHARAL